MQAIKEPLSSEACKPERNARTVDLRSTVPLQFEVQHYTPRHSASSNDVEVNNKRATSIALEPAQIGTRKEHGSFV